MLEDVELLLEVRLETDDATAIEAGGDIVWSAANALSKLPNAPHARVSSNRPIND